MAEIKMDISEYDEMKKNASLLEEALKREKEQNDKIDTLKQEKLDTLKANEKSVTIITKSEVSEYLLQRRSAQEIIHSMNDFVQGARRGHYTQDYAEDRINSFENIFFDKTKAYSTPYEEITTKGLDDVKEDIRKELERNIDEEVQSKLKRLTVTEEELKTVKAKEKETFYELSIANRKNESVIKMKDLAVAETEELKERVENLLKLLKESTKVNEDIKKPFNYFNAYFKLNELRKQI